jgi:hypothetical protein
MKQLVKASRKAEAGASTSRSSVEKSLQDRIPSWMDRSVSVSLAKLAIGHLPISVAVLGIDWIQHFRLTLLQQNKRCFISLMQVFSDQTRRIQSENL